ncbi:AbrB/MazE/SpoVT family DNA-binding domain-containing protein [Hazenella sp. IB182357]|uniref:AbrB/MazE/SpoVT family DNA-binding domain-containing protein n=1 Tax=Polycladospora coralii TaxID=2771432 RepID=A0A926N8Z5_9BACL|nr:AbrB/MazE/SpoVT family DNA-binding domain-containing protein [Polycladospora coralii]MBD1371903.1 AbrB/MazE/SpoVT family DNA-binding domain-containing protein [Polycladospora coralii]
MDTYRVTTKGQVTIPKHVRERLNIGEGDQVTFVEQEGQFIIQKVSIVPIQNPSIRDLYETVKAERDEVFHNLKDR